MAKQVKREIRAYAIGRALYTSLLPDMPDSALQGLRDTIVAAYGIDPARNSPKTALDSSIIPSWRDSAESQILRLEKCSAALGRVGPMGDEIRALVAKRVQHLRAKLAMGADLQAAFEAAAELIRD